MRSCTRCGAEKPLDQFGGRWNHLSYCRPCGVAMHHEDDRARHRDAAYLARTAEQRRARYRVDPVFAESRRRAARAYRAAHPDRKAVQNRAYHARAGWAPRAIYQAVKSGKLVKQPCAVCGDDRVQAHHHRGYEGEALYDVVWLCALHHKEAERE